MNLVANVMNAGISTCIFFLVLAGASTTTPEVINLPLDAMQVYSCSCSAVNIYWEVNGVGSEFTQREGIESGEKEHLGDHILRLNLTVHAYEENNNVTLKCIAIRPGSTLAVEMHIHIQIQGSLVLPDNVHIIQQHSTEIQLEWDSPFTLDITDVDPDISNYTVYITNTNTSNTGTVSVTELDGNGVVETEFTFTGLPGEDPDPCHVYEFSVSAWNVVGEGERSGPEEGWFLGAPLNIIDLDIELPIPPAEQEEITSSLKINISCPGSLPDELKYRVVSTMHTDQIFICPMTDIQPDGSLECGISDNMVIDANSEYSVEVTAVNELGESLPAVKNFSTFDVLTAVIKTTPGTSTIEVTCHFASASQAKGCHVDFLSKDGNTCKLSISKDTQRTQADGTFELPNGNYEILVYDIEADGSLSENPAYEHNETVVVQGSPVSECKVSDDREIEEESGGNKNDQPTIAIIAGSLGAVIVIVTVGIAAALLICKRKRQKVKAVEPNVYGSSPASVPDGPPPAPSCSSSISSEENIAHSYHPLEEPYDYTSTNRTHVDYQNCANPQDSSVSHHSGPPQPGGTSKPPSEPEGGPPPAIPPTVPSHYQNSQNLADPQEKCVTNPQHEQPARAALYVQIDLTHPPHHHIPCHGTSDVTYSQVVHTEPASYRDSPRVGKRRQHTGHEVDHGTNKTGSHFH